MGLLENMRAGTDSTFMQVVLALVVVSFIFWYAAPQGEQSSVVAEVNGQKIMDTVLNREYRSAARRQGRVLSDEEASRLREQVRQQVIEDEVLYQEATRLGIEVSDTEVARQLLKIPSFRNEEDKFDDRMYANTLRQMGWNRADFEEDLRRDLIREKLRRMVFFGATISEPVVREHFVRTNTRIDVEYVRVRANTFLDDVEITDEDEALWMEENAELVEAEYKSDFERLYDVPEKVEFSMIKLSILQDGLGAADLLPRVKGLRAELEAGADFTDVARRWSEDPSAERGGDMGQLSLPQLDEKVQTALSTVEPGQLSEVVTTDDGVHVFRLDSREAAHIIPMEEVQGDIAERLIREQRAPTLSAGFADRLLADWSALGTVPEAILDEQGLTTMTTGPVVAAPDNSPFSPPMGMLEAAMTARVGGVLPDVYEKGGVLWVGRLTERTEPDMALYETEKEFIQEETLMARRSELYEAWVTDLVASADIR